LALWLLPPALGAQAPSLPLPAVIEGMLRDLATHEDPLVRGEAALGLATAGDPNDYDTVLAVARDREPQAQLRGLLALGYLAAPGSEAFLGSVLAEADRRDPARAAAALALGLLPEHHATPAIDAYLRTLGGASYRQHRDTLLALLLGLTREPHPSRAAAVRALLADAANREPAIRRLAIDVLARVSGSLPAPEAARLLRSGETAERLGVLSAIRAGVVPAGADDIEEIVRIARRDRSAAVRAAALEVLTVRRHLVALELAPRALRSRDPDEAAAGVTAALRLGGGALRMAIEQHVLAARDGAAQSRMLKAYDASRSTTFLDACLQIANDPRRAHDTRIAAAGVLARSGDARAVPTARDLFLEADGFDHLLALTDILSRMGALDRFIDDTVPPRTPTDARLLPLRLRAWLSAGHPRAMTLLGESLERSRKTPAAQAELLHALRSALLPALDRDCVALAEDTPIADLLR
jgi:hypothetical protein